MSTINKNLKMELGYSIVFHSWVGIPGFPQLCVEIRHCQNNSIYINWNDGNCINIRELQFANNTNKKTLKIHEDQIDQF